MNTFDAAQLDDVIDELASALAMKAEEVLQYRGLHLPDYDVLLDECAWLAQDTVGWVLSEMPIESAHRCPGQARHLRLVSTTMLATLADVL